MNHNPFVPATAILCWSMAFTFNSAALADGLTPTSIVAGRIVIAAAGFVVLFRARIIRYRPLPVRMWPRMLLTAAVGLLAYHFALVYGQRGVSAGVAALVVMTSPVWATAISVAIGHERLTALRVVGLAVATAGAIIVLSDGVGGEVPPFHAIVILLMAPISLALFTILAKPLLIHGSANVTAQLTIVAAAPLSVIAMIEPRTAPVMGEVSLAGVAAGADAVRRPGAEGAADRAAGRGARG